MQQQQGEAAGGADLQLQLQMRGGNEEEELVLATWDCGSPLYDSLELASLHYVLDKAHDGPAVLPRRRGVAVAAAFAASASSGRGRPAARHGQGRQPRRRRGRCEEEDEGVERRCRSCIQGCYVLEDRAFSKLAADTNIYVKLCSSELLRFLVFLFNYKSSLHPLRL